MTLPTPNLDDRQFQDIVDEAKRRIPHHCPEWTDHNVSDPGIALIELFAWMTEMVIYRLNQVPDQLFIRFLDLVGIRLFPPAAARTRLLFRLTKPQPRRIAVPDATQVATRRSEPGEPVVFMTDREAVMNPAILVACHTVTADDVDEDRWDDLRSPDVRIPCFPTTTAGDAIYFGLEQPLPCSLLALSVSGVVASVGVVPSRPPWTWEVWTADAGWAPAEVIGDSTSALQKDGTLELLLPDRHQPRALGDTRTHWLRCRLTETQPRGPEGEPRPPRINDVRVATVGVAVGAHHASARPAERLGRSTGAPAQAFTVGQPPVLERRAGETVTVDGDRWEEVEDFADSGPDDRHFTWDSATGEVTFGPIVHHADGSTTRHGAVPDDGAVVAVTGYRTGGGRQGNVGAHTLKVLRSGLPFVATVDNLEAAHGGLDGETIADACRRGPLTLLTSQRAVTASDFERLAAEASPDVARVRCLPPKTPPTPDRPEEERAAWWEREKRWWEEQLREGGGVVPGEPEPREPRRPEPAGLHHPIRVLIAPRREAPPDQLDLDELVPDEALLSVVRDYLDERRTLTSEIELGNLWFQGVKVVTVLQCNPTAAPEAVQQRALAALYRYVNPLVGGPGGTGWPFDRPLTVGEIHSLLAGLDGVEYADQVELIPVAHMGRGELDEPRQRIPLPPHALFASYRHEVRTA
jgi:predicted phage baseplate assembly protein